jgi:hypothetical protein
MTLRLHIERLVVEGLDLSRAEAEHLGAALKAELAGRLAEAPFRSWTDLAVSTLTVEPISVSHQVGSPQLGREAAAALHEGLSQ